MEETSKIFIEAFKQAPQYFSTFGALILSPIKFIGEQVDDESIESLSRAFMFAAMSAFIVVLSVYVMVPRSDFTKILLISVLTYIVEIILLFIVFSIGFRIISYPISSHKIVTTVLYLFSVAQFIGTIAILQASSSMFWALVQFCWFLVPIRALALNANLNYRQGIGLVVIIIPAYMAAETIWMAVFNSLMPQAGLAFR